MVRVVTIEPGDFGIHIISSSGAMDPDGRISIHLTANRHSGKFSPSWDEVVNASSVLFYSFYLFYFLPLSHPVTIKSCIELHR
jgi:hypothetical protein